MLLFHASDTGNKMAAHCVGLCKLEKLPKLGVHAPVFYRHVIATCLRRGSEWESGEAHKSRSARASPPSHSSVKTKRNRFSRVTSLNSCNFP